jgi:hypothetical protein
MDDDALAGLVLDMVTVRADLDDLRGLITELAVRVDELDAPARAKHHALPCWSTLEPEAARTAWTALTDWMRDVLVIRYPDTERALVPVLVAAPRRRRRRHGAPRHLAGGIRASPCARRRCRHLAGPLAALGPAPDPRRPPRLLTNAPCRVRPTQPIGGSLTRSLPRPHPPTPDASRC